MIWKKGWIHPILHIGPGAIDPILPIVLEHFIQRIYINDIRDSTSHRLTKMWLIQPLPACSVRQSGSRVYCRQSGERLGESQLCKTMVGAVPSITNIIYIFNLILFFRSTLCKIASAARNWTNSVHQQQWRPLPSLLYKSLFYADCVPFLLQNCISLGLRPRMCEKWFWHRPCLVLAEHSR